MTDTAAAGGTTITAVHRPRGVGGTKTTTMVAAAEVEAVAAVGATTVIMVGIGRPVEVTAMEVVEEDEVVVDSEVGAVVTVMAAEVEVVVAVVEGTTGAIRRLSADLPLLRALSRCRNALVRRLGGTCMLLDTSGTRPCKPKLQVR